MVISSEYLSHRPYLVAIAYNMIGARQQAEDIVQDTFEDVVRYRNSAEIKNAKSYLTRIVLNKAIDHLKWAKKEREVYPGLWLPEPYLSLKDQDHNEDVLPYVFLVMLERLTPIERAVLLLREAFNFSYEEIALLCDNTEDNCRQILHRVKKKLPDLEHVTGGKIEGETTLLNAFVEACLSGDTTKLTALLKSDIQLYSDGGGKVVAARKILEGLSNVTKFLLGIAEKAFKQWSGARPVSVNGHSGILIPDANGIYMIIVPYIEEGKLRKLYLMRNPDKIIFQEHVTKTRESRLNSKG